MTAAEGDAQARLLEALAGREQELEGRVAQLLAEQHAQGQAHEALAQHVGRLAGVLERLRGEAESVGRMAAAESARAKELQRASDERSRELVTFAATQAQLAAQLEEGLARRESEERETAALLLRVEGLQAAHRAVTADLAAERARSARDEEHHRRLGEALTAAEQARDSLSQQLAQRTAQLERALETISHLEKLAALDRQQQQQQQGEEEEEKGSAAAECRRLRDELEHARLLVQQASTHDEAAQAATVEELRRALQERE